MASGDLQVKSYIFQILQRFLISTTTREWQQNCLILMFCLGSIVDLCQYRFSEMDHKIFYFLGRLTAINL